MSNILSLKDVADRLKVNRETARRWAVTKVIPAFKIHDRGHWQFTADDIDKFIAKRQSEHGPEQGQSAD